MKSARIAELKNRLSYYLRFVRRGQSVLIYDRDRPIARIDPVRSPVSAESADRIAQLEQAGMLRAPSLPLPRDWLAKRIPVKSDVVAALLDERESGR
jgi:antitoxin (DNA-binding transcriptional repressor) of toxin-antitoxin stability system